MMQAYLVLSNLQTNNLVNAGGLHALCVGVIDLIDQASLEGS